MREKASTKILNSEIPVNCEACSDIGYLKVPPEIAPGQPWTRCECSYQRAAQRVIGSAPSPIRGTLADQRLVPEKDYRSFPPMTLPKNPVQPSDYVAKHGFPLQHQQELLDRLSKDPRAGYGLYGPTGTGKTFLLYALAKEAAYAGQTAIIRTASKFIEGMRLSQTGDEIHPWAIDLEMIASRTHIFIDELDAIPTTEFSQRKIFELFSLCWDRMGEVWLSVAANEDPEKLSKIIGAASVRRMQDLTPGSFTSRVRLILGGNRDIS